MSLPFYNNAKVLLYIKEYEHMQPVHLEIHPAMDCNHQCVWCRYTKDNMQLTLGHMIGKLNKYPKVKAVTLSGGGEPLNNPYTIEFIKECYNRGIQVGLNTNGALLDDDNIHKIARWCRYCRISLDAPNAVVHTMLHRPAQSDWDKIIYAIKQLRNYEIRELGISYLVVAKNVWGISTLPDLKLPVDYWHFKPLIQGISDDIKHDAVARLTQIEGKINARWDRILHDDVCNNKIPCRISHLIRLIGGDGKEYVCCEKAYIPEFEIDNWTGDIDSCKSCRYNGYNEVLESYYNGSMAKEFI
jgi:MoaA/NifB/PqqE/SkfB family radical SAM enzyme